MTGKLKFSANINMMFTEIPELPARIAAARRAGFDAFETTVPFSASIQQLQEAAVENKMKCTLVNMWPGPGGEGITCRPGKEAEFGEKLELTIEYARALSCDKVHVIAGCIREEEEDPGLVESTYLANMRHAASRLEREGITLLVEFVNSINTCPGYLVDTLHKATRYISLINAPNCKLQMDTFHLQMTLGNLSMNVREHMKNTGYIQISQVPNRNEPSFPGEIDYDYLLQVIRDSGYTDYIGLEYKPSGRTEDSLKWMEKWR